MSASPQNLAPQSVRFTPSAATVKRWRRIALHTGQSWVKRLFEQIDGRYATFIEKQPQRTPSAGWLLRYRLHFRRAEASPPASAIRLYLSDCPEHMLPIAIWLLGRCATRCEHYHLFEFAESAPPAARRHAARALRRIEAWPELRQLAAAAPKDPRIAWYASAPVSHRTFRERLNNFTDLLDHSHAAEVATPSQMALWFADLDWIRRPSKPVDYIRRILMRIHHWVHGVD